jgi:Fic family protein
MPINDLAIRFTDDHYATKQDVAKQLGTAVVDALWGTILSYRSTFARILPLQAMDKQSLQIVLTPSLLEKSIAFDRKMAKAVSLFNYHQIQNQLNPHFQKLFIPILTSIGKQYGASTAERNLTYIIEEKPVDRKAELSSVNAYYQSLKLIATRRQSKLDEDLMGELLMLLTNTQELNMFYREKELTNRPRSLVARVYEAAPYPMIEPMMQALLNTIKQLTLSPIIVATIGLYYLDYIKPFEVFNDELSFLLFKNILVHSDYESVPCYLNIEQMMENEQYEKRMLEVQRSGDVTYLLDFILPYMHASIDQLLDQLVTMQKQHLIQEQKSMNITPILTGPSPSPLPKETAPFSASESTIGEVEANRLQQHLLETHPSMKKGEAYFYARHHSLGKYYTLAQYKKLLDCAYETARTSMEHLVKLGYYRKEKYKNKYVYTTVDLKGVNHD